MNYNRNRKLFEIDCNLDMDSSYPESVVLNLIPIDCPCGKKICNTKGVHPKPGEEFNCDKFVSISREEIDSDTYGQSLTTVKILCRGSNSFNFIMED